MRIGILVPHIFAQQVVIERIIFAPIFLAISLAEQLSDKDEVYLFTPGKVNTTVKNIYLDLSLLENELDNEKCSLSEFVVKNPLAFTSVSRQIHSEITAKAFDYANCGNLDVLHVFMCEDEIPLYFSNLVRIPVIFTHHDPFNFYRKYRVRFPKLKNLNYVSISLSQQKTAPKGLNFVGNVYNGLDIKKYVFNDKPDDYFAFLGRIIRIKGCHTAIKCCKDTGNKLRIAGKYYTSAGDKDNDYWESYIKPNIDNNNIFYDGFLKYPEATSKFLSSAKALLFPIEWDEPFGLVMIEALATGTPVIAFNTGAVPEIIVNGKNGYIVKNEREMKFAMKNIDKIDRRQCRISVEKEFTIAAMAEGYRKIYDKLLRS